MAFQRAISKHHSEVGRVEGAIGKPEFYALKLPPRHISDTLTILELLSIGSLGLIHLACAQPP
jgi:hypothetical protein